jgi:hypothetical protein
MGLTRVGLNRVGLNRVGLNRVGLNRVGLARAGLALLGRPALWPTAARLVPARWWCRWPPRPWPPPDYIHFRTETMYGADGRIDPADLVRYLEWCRRMGRPAR